MTRTERAALRLALGVLRRSCGTEHGVTDARPSYRQREVLLSARLALYLRAVLRAADGDDGPFVRCWGCCGTGCVAQDANCISDGGCCEECKTTGRLGRLPMRPLWEQAPPHEGRP